MARELELFLTRLEQTTGDAPRRSGDGWQAHCPAHDDQRASLSIRSGTAGRVLVYCHAGCTPQAICQSLELDLSALMPDDEHAQRALYRYVESRRQRDHRLPNELALTDTSHAVLSTPPAHPPGTLCPPTYPSPTFPTREEALRVVTARRGEPDGCWQYHDQTGECVGLVLRWNTTEGKAIRPLARVEGGWVIGAMRTPRPLYALYDILPFPISGGTPGASSDGRGALRSLPTSSAATPFAGSSGTCHPSARPRVYVVEGEKAADAGRRLGLVCTTSSGGAAATHLTDWSPLAGRDVVVLPDNDEPGRKYAAAVIAQLLRLRPLPTVRQVRLPDSPAAGDLDDFVAAHAELSVDEIVSKLAALTRQITPVTPAQPAPVTPGQIPEEPTTMLTTPNAVANRAESFAPQAVFTRLAECTPTRLHWLWPGRVPLGKLTLLIGDPGLGKSFVTLDVAARVSRGLNLPALTGEAPPPATAPGSVVLLSAEDDALDTIHPRLAAAGADLDRIDVLNSVRQWHASDGSQYDSMFSLQSDLALLEQAIAERDNCRLVVIDPITAYLGRSDSHRNSEMRALLAPLSELAARTGVAVLAVNHLNKMGQGPAIYRSMGSLAFAATARSVLAVMSDPNEADARVLVSLKSNVSAATAGMRFRMLADDQSIDGVALDGEPPMPTVRWSDQPVAMTAEEIISAAAQSVECGPALDEACQWLRSALAAGPQAANELKRIAKSDGIRERTLLRAKQRLGVVARRTGFGLGGSWEWQLPESKSSDAMQPDGQLPDA